MSDEVEQFFGEIDTKKGKLPPTCEGTIVEMHVRTGGELFGDKVRVHDEWGETKDQAKAKQYLQLIIQTPYEFDVRTSLSKSKHPQSNLGKFIAMYGARPSIGMKVNLVQRKGSDGRDYYRLYI